MSRYAFCETATASGLSPWHIRPLTEAGKKLGGGADTPALCGRVVAWDLEVEPSPQHYEHTCKKCLDVLFPATQDTIDARNRGIALHILRQQAGWRDADYNAQVVSTILDWIDSGMQGGVPWPDSPFFDEWAKANGYVNHNGKIGSRLGGAA